jgi:hypothetical protein
MCGFDNGLHMTGGAELRSDEHNVQLYTMARENFCEAPHVNFIKCRNCRQGARLLIYSRPISGGPLFFN